MTEHLVIEPATEEILAAVPLSTPEGTDDAIERARLAQMDWAAAAPIDRAGILQAIGDAIHQEAEQLAQLEARNVGMPIEDARSVVRGAADTFRFYASSPQRHHGRTIPVPGGVNMTFPEPLGVVGVITPWNFPFAIAAWKIAPALAAGNAVIHKPSELTPLTALALQRIAIAAGLPPDLLRVLVGEGATVGQQIVDHRSIRKIAFTGSTAVGRKIAADAARDIKRVGLELGGKSASIVFADSDLEAAAQGLSGGVFGNSGQDCCARSRVFVERSALDVFMQLLEVVVHGIRVGDPLNP
jgi:betaine-aldehyde dehydrogenase